MSDLQKIATDKQFPLLVAVEMSAMWKGRLADHHIVEATYQSGAVWFWAHPGHHDRFICCDRALPDELRCEAQIDGIEAYYPVHT